MRIQRFTKGLNFGTTPKDLFLLAYWLSLPLLLASCFIAGKITGPSSAFNPLPPPAPSLSTFGINLFAGSTGGAGNLDGAGPAARFDFPSGVANDVAGNLYVADANNHVIRKITSAGFVTTFAGATGLGGSADGAGSSARFNSPRGLAVDAVGSIYVADTGNSTIRKITSAGLVTTLAGTPGLSGSVDGTGSAASFNSPQALAVDAGGSIYVTDTYNHTIRRISSVGVVTTLAGVPGMTGAADGTGSAARFSFPQGVAADAGGDLYVADSNNHTIRKITSGGVVSTFAGSAGLQGSADGTGSAASFNSPQGLAVDTAGNIYVADAYNHTIRQITSVGFVTTLAGAAGLKGASDGTGSIARLNIPQGLAIDAANNVFVADTNNNSIRKITSAGNVTTFAGEAGYGSADGVGSAASFNHPRGLVIDTASNMYVADTDNSTIRKITPSGVVTTFAGAAGANGSADGVGSAASFNSPRKLAVDAAGNIYVADTYNSEIRKITPSGIVSTLAGAAGLNGSADGAGSAARFYYPHGLAVGAGGDVYVADTYNHTIRQITPGGVVTTIAGAIGLSGSTDGTGAAARFSYPQGLAVDAGGNIFVAETSTIRKITPSGVVTTFAGTAGLGGSTDGTGSAARFNSVEGLAIDTAGNVYAADNYNSTIRRITNSGVVTTIAGVAGSSGVRLGILPGGLGHTFSVAVSSSTLFLTSSNSILYLPIP